ncbi:Cys-tRNA(Pro) deacylase [Pallidibacillus pasinlerensis]|uniref:Cys-tRNA(Pro)/Cys-tRNA(Cys) deacylase n=1 Tax=Pallidibacillus pasinlerensis TaxID=2703818 RepID=A0ABX0A4I5_9BACI|nr:Cys-tRNA(Pro) deacylase [Pallidibacillus pasinlerensis]NCU18327.1 Cys-tRNA(Pro) deacylase [Pallidibacillus pasinlerensis]
MVPKTNALRILDKEKVEYNIITYNVKDGKIDGESIAEKIGRAPEFVYKTLVTHNKGNLFVFVIPVMEELDLKEAAKVVGAKKVEMLPLKDLQKHTGYIRGGCSPVGMKKLYPTYIDVSAQQLSTIIVSAGKIGIQMEVNPKDLAKVTKAEFVEVLKK